MRKYRKPAVRTTAKKPAPPKKRRKNASTKALTADIRRLQGHRDRLGGLGIQLLDQIGKVVSLRAQAADALRAAELELKAVRS